MCPLSALFFVPDALKMLAANCLPVQLVFRLDTMTDVRSETTQVLTNIKVRFWYSRRNLLSDKR